MCIRDSSSTAVGHMATAEDDCALAVGYIACVSSTGIAATSVGYRTIACQAYSIAVGHCTQAIASRSTAFGFCACATAICSTAIGHCALASADCALVLGGCWVGIGISAPTSDLHITGSTHLAMTDTTSTSSGTGNRDIASTAHGLSVGDSVKIPSGASSAFEKFSVTTVTDADNFVVDSDLTNAVTDVQIYKDSSLLKIDTGDGVNKVTVDKSGNVGIGTTTPVEKLHVHNSGSGHTYILACNTNTTTWQSALQLKTGNTDWIMGTDAGNDS